MTTRATRWRVTERGPLRQAGEWHFRKIPMRKALSDAGVLPMTDAGQFWYVLSCIAFGAGYFAKIPRKKALTELAQLPGAVVPRAYGSTLVTGDPA